MRHEVCLYRSVPSLGEYALVSHNERNVEVFRLNEYNRRELYQLTGEDDIEFASVGYTLTFEEIYHDLDDITEQP